MERSSQDPETESRLLRVLINAMPDAIYAKDINCRFTLGNERLARVMGAKSADDLLGKSDADFYPPEFAEHYLADEQRILDTGKPLISREERLVDADGKACWASTTKVPLFDREGKVCGMVGISRDITDRKIAQEKLVETARQLEARTEQLEGDLEMAREIQMAFVTRLFETFPKDAVAGERRIEFNHTYIPAATLAGDFFYMLPVSDDEVGVLVCDVMGHGVRAALLTAFMRGLIEELRSVAHDPARFMTKLNEDLLEGLRESSTFMFTTAVYALANVRTGQLRCCNAGHSAPMLVSSETGEPAFLRNEGYRKAPALGIRPGSHYEEFGVTMKQGDLVLLFTDGLVETENKQGERFGGEGLLASARGLGGCRPQELTTKVLESARAFSASTAFEDDICLVAIGLRGE